jgi:hypothetical protein
MSTDRTRVSLTFLEYMATALRIMLRYNDDLGILRGLHSLTALKVSLFVRSLNTTRSNLSNRYKLLHNNVMYDTLSHGHHDGAG